MVNNAVVVVAFIFVQYNDLCGRFADSNYFYTGIDNVHEFSCTSNAIWVHATCTIVTVHEIWESLLMDHKVSNKCLFWEFHNASQKISAEDHEIFNAASVEDQDSITNLYPGSLWHRSFHYRKNF